MPMLIPLLLQVGLGLGPMHAGLNDGAGSGRRHVSKQLAVRLVERFGYRRVLMVNTVLVRPGDGQLHPDDTRPHLAWRLLQLAFLRRGQFAAVHRDEHRDPARSGP